MERVRKQLFSLERALRAVRVELDSEIIKSQSRGINSAKVIKVSSGLEMLVSSSNAIAKRLVSPYEQFFPNLCCSAMPEKPTNKVFIESVSHESSYSSDGEQASSCLIVKPEYDADDLTPWMSIETDLDVDAMRRISNLSVRFIPCFNVSSARIIDNLIVELRIFGSEKDKFNDYCIKTYPSLDVPLELRYFIDSDAYSGLPLKEATRAVLIMSLPVDAEVEYSFVLSHIEITGSAKG